MPLYVYICEQCGHIINKLQSMEDRNNCPKCDKCSGDTKKVIQNVNFVGPKNKGNW